jgi:hypothetical protein
MKRIAAVGAAMIAVVVLILPATASAGTGAPTKAQFNALKNRVAQLERDTDSLAYLALYNECNDAWQWSWLESIVAEMGYDPGQPYGDPLGACAAIGFESPKVAARKVQSTAPEFGLEKPDAGQKVARAFQIARQAS